MTARFGGWAGWLMKRLHAGRRERPRLEFVERITIGARQTVALIDAEGQRLLIVCTAEGAPAIYPLNRTAQKRQRVSW
jgi:flagellar biogenesis protein FliO